MNKSQLIENLKAQGFSKEITEAFSKVQRENFIPKKLRLLAYEDTALPLEKGATISQPTTIAFMLTLLEPKPKQKILEIGSGCGYVLALLSNISQQSKLYGIEIIQELAKKSKTYLKNYKNITIFSQDGSNGLPAKSPFDRILISASAKTLPKHLYKQLSPNGILVTPVNNSIYQIKKQDNKITEREYPGFIFVPLKTTQSPFQQQSKSKPLQLK